MNEWMHGCMFEWMGRMINEWMDRWRKDGGKMGKEGQMDGSRDGWMNE